MKGTERGMQGLQKLASVRIMWHLTMISRTANSPP